MICNKCGKENENTNKNCTSCSQQLIFEVVNSNYENNNKTKKSKKLIFIIIGLIIGIPLLIFLGIVIISLVIATFDNTENYFEGKWFCDTYEDFTNYSIALDFSGKRFNIYKYTDEANNYINGNYDYEQIENSDNYELKLDVDKYVSDGKLKNQKLDNYIVKFSSDEDNNQMIIMDKNQNIKCYCIKR